MISDLQRCRYIFVPVDRVRLAVRPCFQPTRHVQTLFLHFTYMTLISITSSYYHQKYTYFQNAELFLEYHSLSLLSMVYFIHQSFKPSLPHEASCKIFTTTRVSDLSLRIYRTRSSEQENYQCVLQT